MDIAYLAHQVRGRIRFRIPGRCKDIAYFAELENRMGDCPGISCLETCPRTGSLLLLHGGATDAAAIAAYAEQSGLFRAEALPALPDKPTLTERAVTTIDVVDRGLLRASGGHVDLSSAILISLLSLSARQALRGQIMLPATSLLWYAYMVVSAKKNGR